MKYFLDTEFLEGTQKEKFPISLFRKNTKPTIDLISIGIVSEDGREYYAICKEFDIKAAWNDKWLRGNVLKPIFYELVGKDINFHDYDMHFNYKYFKTLISKYGKTRKQIAEEIINFVSEGTGLQVQCGIKKHEFYAYYADYDWVVFCWLFGRMIDLPDGFPMYCIDLQQESDRIYNLKKEEYIKGGGKNFINKMSNHLDYPKQTNEHNALADARWNKELYNFIEGL